MSVELELVRDERDRRLYALGSVGTLRLEGRSWRAAAAETGEASLRFARAGVWRRTAGATDGDAVVGGFEPGRGLRRGGTLRWRGRDLALRGERSWRSQRFALVESGLVLATLDGGASGRRPVRVTADDPDAAEPGLLLFAVFVVRGLTLDAWSGVSAGSVVAAGG